MATRIFNQSQFRGEGALITQGSLFAGHTTKSGRFSGLAERDPKDYGSAPVAIFLRWQVNPVLGLPSEPFKIWRRPATPLAPEKEIEASTVAMPPLGYVVQFSEPHVSVTAGIKAGAAPRTIVVIALAGGISFESMLYVQRFDLPANGQRVFTFQAPHITGLLLMGTSSLTTLQGIAQSNADAIEGWELVETVGLPVKEAEWSDLTGQDHGIKQGLVGAEVDARLAAAQRYQRGVNPFGWRPTFQAGEQAPLWQFPTAAQLIKDADIDVLPMLHEALRLAPQNQGAFSQVFGIKPPQNANGDALSVDDGQAEVLPISLVQLAASTDPLQAVTLGFGTGYLYEDIPTINLGKISLFGDPDVSDWDYMVTGLWARGLDRKSKDVEFATLIPRPRKVIPPPAPADLQLDFLAHLQPDAPDLPWKVSVRSSWERLPLDNISAVASFVAGRHEAAVAQPATALLEKRPSGTGHIPIGNTTNPRDPERVRQSATDSAYPIPNNPGSVNAKYGVATQNIFGIWSPWVTASFSSNQPAPDLVQIVDMTLRPIDTGSGTVCPADLVIEFVVDWRVRSVTAVQFRGRLFAAATRHQAPPAGMPAGIQKSLGSSAVATVLDFVGDTPTFPLGSVISLDAQGGTQVTPGSSQQGQSRRYRITIPAFSLDYASTPHIGLALQARLTEAITPGRVSAWTPTPKVAYASDPRARPTTVLDIVQLASLPDANGECHARISWNAVPGMQGYILYESNETKVLTGASLPSPTPGMTPSARLTNLKNAFRANPDRNNFTRVDRELLTSESRDITLPRGSQVIHLYVVIPLSAGGTEGPWPSGPNADEALIAYLAPKVGEPAPPTLEITRVPDGPGFAAQLRIGTRGDAGARPKQIDIYRTRVADAARQLDSMGPPIASVTTTGGPWTVAESGTVPDTWIDTARGNDSPSGSWKYVWYRAVAWSEDNPVRGVRKGRSRPSSAATVVIPPDSPPPLSPLLPSWPGGGPGDVAFNFSSSVPVLPTPLGPHVFAIDVTEQGASTPLVREMIPLHEVTDSQPGAGSGLWRVPDSLGQNYRLLVRRDDANQAASVTLRLTDPIGRTSERTFRIEEGPILPLPELSPIDSFTMAGRGKFYSFTIDNAPDEAAGGKFYRLRITLTPVSSAPGLASPRPGRRPRTPFLPRPGPIIDLGTVRRGSQFRKINDTLVFFRPVKDIPTAASTETFSVTRQRLGERLTIMVRARVKIRSIEVEVDTPDGRNVSRRTRG